MRQCSILVFRDLPTGDTAMAGFLVDLGCPGLKDTWGQLQFTEGAFIDGCLDPLCDALDIEVVTPQEALHLIRGAARHAAECGFRLPNDWERWAALIGEVGDWRDDADTSEFEMAFCGAEEDLRLRLVDSTVEDFLARDDVEVNLVDEDEYLPSINADDVELEEAIKMASAAFADQVRRWCFAKGQKPHPRLAEAVPLMMMSTTGALDGAPEADVAAAISDDDLDHAVSPDTLKRMALSLLDLLSVYPAKEAAELRAAVDQCISFIGENPEAFSNMM
jgi:hypothetical protein